MIFFFTMGLYKPAPKRSIIYYSGALYKNLILTVKVMTMVPRLLRQFRKLLQIKKSIANAPRVL